MLSDAVIYAVGVYNSLEDAMKRQRVLEEKGFLATNILVDNNGEIADYTPFVPQPIIDVDLVALSTDSFSVDSSEMSESLDMTIYRIQIGAFSQPLSDAVFAGVKNVISFIGRNGLYVYMAGSFTKYDEAIDYQAQMRVRGFADAYIVNYKNGKRISLDVAIADNNSIDNKMAEIALKDELLEFVVQIMVSKVLVSTAELNKMNKLGNIDKEAEGLDIYRYYAGTYKTLEDANIRLSEAKLAGYEDAFIFAKLNGERISVEQAKKY